MSTRKIEGSGSGGEPDLKRRRLLDAGGPVEDDETARQKMREAKVYEPEGDVAAGFDPDNVADIKHFYARQSYDIYRIKPMGYFAEKGDLKMMRWLYVNGADTRDEEVGFYFPMIRAVSRGHTDVCKWLFAHGASDDVQRRTNADSQFFPLNNDIGCVYLAKKREMTRWLTLNGALCKENTRGELDIRVMRKDISGGGEGAAAFLVGKRPTKCPGLLPNISYGHALPCRAHHHVLTSISSSASSEEAGVRASNKPIAGFITYRSVSPALGRAPCRWRQGTANPPQYSQR